MLVEQEENMQIELLTPLTAEFIPDENDWDDLEEDDGVWGRDSGRMPLDGADLVQYKDAIQKMVDEENTFGSVDGKPCNLMQYFGGSPDIKEKVESAIVSVKEVDHVLYGCTTLRLNDYLESHELTKLCEYITGQYSDGWGEGFEQRDIRVDGGNINVHFWQCNRNFCFRQASEIESQKQEGKGEKAVRWPKMKLLGHDGNIFSIMGDARRLRVRNGQSKDADEMFQRVQNCDNYYQALGIISEYVETELSVPRQEKEKPHRKPEKGGTSR